MMLANLKGDEKMLLQMDSTWINRHTFLGSENRKADRYEWKYNNGELDTLEAWKEEKDYDPRVRPWFIEAIQLNGQLNWTEPYVFFTTKDPGITASRMWINNHNEAEVFGFDLMLMDISYFTSNLKISENGKVFILTEDDKALLKGLSPASLAISLNLEILSNPIQRAKASGITAPVLDPNVNGKCFVPLNDKASAGMNKAKVIQPSPAVPSIGPCSGMCAHGRNVASIPIPAAIANAILCE